MKHHLSRFASSPSQALRPLHGALACACFMDCGLRQSLGELT
jgi:hypothetical protein